MNKLLLNRGNPSFLHPYWEQSGFHNEKWIGLNATNYHDGFNRELTDSIRWLHREQGNANPDNRRVVIGNGASQLVGGLMRILEGPVYAHAPHFSRFPIMADYAGKQWDTGGIQVVTVPNNPDGSAHFSIVPSTTSVIYDLSYNWKQYWQDDGVCPKFDQDIMVFSLAKATGHAGSRFGWALIKDDKLADDLINYVENSTLGVSTDAQVKAKDVIDSQIGLDYDDTVFHFGKKVLDERWEIIRNTQFPFKVLNDSGMFLYAEGEMPSDLVGIPGHRMGVSENKFRLCIGGYQGEFDDLIRKYV